MSEPSADWAAALAAVERAVVEQTAALDEYERRFAAVLTPPPAGPRLAIAATNDPADGWAERIATATAKANEIDRLLADQQSACGRWREAFSAWEASVQQPPGGPAAG